MPQKMKALISSDLPRIHALVTVPLHISSSSSAQATSVRLHRQRRLIFKGRRDSCKHFSNIKTPEKCQEDCYCALQFRCMGITEMFPSARKCSEVCLQSTTMLKHGRKMVTEYQRRTNAANFQPNPINLGTSGSLSHDTSSNISTNGIKMTVSRNPESRQART